MVAYISRIIYPDPSANSVQTIQMAAAMAQIEEHTWLFVHDLSAPEEQIHRDYGLGPGGVRFWPLRARRWPGFLYNHAALRFLAYNSSVAAILGFHPTWRRLTNHGKILFVRSRLETLYWGLLRPYLPWMRGWLFACEIHDLPVSAPGETGRARRMIRALRSYDLVVAVNHALAADLKQMSGGRVEASVVPLCSGMERLPSAPVVILPEERVIAGYFGTIDLAHGVDTLIQALALLPERFSLRLVGRVRDDARDVVAAGLRTGRVELTGPVPYGRMTAEIDSCHLALVPAGSTTHAARYRSPLKIFDSMLRGRPIVAADAPCHRELLRDGENAVLFRSGDPVDLAEKVAALADNPDLLQKIACAAWAQSETYTYPARARALFALIAEARERKQMERRER